MCKTCVDEGLLTPAELDERVMAGDTSVIDIRDRLAGGVPVAVIAVEMLLGVDEPTARQLVEMLG